MDEVPPSRSIKAQQRNDESGEQFRKTRLFHRQTNLKGQQIEKRTTYLSNDNNLINGNHSKRQLSDNTTMYLINDNTLKTTTF